ncbi:hypothetical protein ABS771_19985 [Methylobacterium brachiatum]|uniref:Uncharacterized protein n=1 Tax=Methylobacterium brachiatum TaxID=269660 RepID=A0ABV1R4T1_9HYPH
MIHIATSDHPDDSLADLLCEALDAAADPIRIALLTRLCILTANADRDADLDRMRAEGLPQVFRA